MGCLITEWNITLFAIRLKNDGIIRLSFILFSGYRFFKFMLFLAGFLVAFVFTYLLCSAYLTDELSGNALKYKEQVCMLFKCS